MKLEKSQIVIILAFAVVLLGSLVLISEKSITGNTVLTQDNLTRFTLCLTEKNVKLYGAEDSQQFLAQKEMFGEDFKNIIYVDCVKYRDECGDIFSFPSWKINDEVIPNALSLKTLSKFSRCNL